MSTSRTALPEWQTIEKFKSTIDPQFLRSAFQSDADRFKRYSIEEDGLLFDFSKNLINDEILNSLLKLAECTQVQEKLAAICNGDVVNLTENNPAFHTGLRNFSNTPLLVNNQDLRPEIEAERSRMLNFATQLHEKRYLGSTGQVISHVVNIGIGGSDLGPRAVIDGLQPYQSPTAPKLLTLSSMDGDHLRLVLEECSPETTIFILVSKSFGTEETRLNGERAKAWLTEHLGASNAAKHMFAVTTNIEAAQKIGVPAEQCFKMWRWVGGRFSLWSSVGLPIAIQIGAPAFLELLKGAYSIDKHAVEAPLRQNIPAIMALLGIWYRNFLGFSTQAVVPYPRRLRMLISHLQQMDMESNGKAVTHENLPVDYPTAPILWGGAGNQGQHAYFQLLHQGTENVPLDFILEARPHHTDISLHQHLIANALAQSQAFMNGTDQASAEHTYQECKGNRPSNTFFFDQLTPYNMGRLVALYEQKVAIQGIIWNINSFDQWGVALGKKLATQIKHAMVDASTHSQQDTSTQGLLNFFARHTQ